MKTLNSRSFTNKPNVFRKQANQTPQQAFLRVLLREADFNGK
jgi:hypothetical protein